MGKLIVIDGLDGSGKATQSNLLYEKLKAMGKNVYKVSFPNYQSESSRAVRMYLGGEMGKNPSELNPYICSLFYSIDRGIQFIQELYSLYNQPDSIIICDRYISANIIHQGGKIKSDKEQKDFFDWVYDTEINKIKLPKEDITIILSLPVHIGQKLMLKRYNNQSEKKDIHESDIDYLKLCYDTVDKAIVHLKNMGYNWYKIDCSDGKDDIRTMDDIEKDIWLAIKDLV